MNDPQLPSHDNEDMDNELPSPNTEASAEINDSGQQGNEENTADEYNLAPLEEQPVVAELVEDEGSARTKQVSGPAVNPIPRLNRLPVDVAVEFQNMSAIGGAVGAIVLGIWSIICSMITPFSAINGILALILGIWGLSSKHRRLAITGIVLGLTGLFLSLFEINETLSSWFAAETPV